MHGSDLLHPSHQNLNTEFSYPFSLQTIAQTHANKHILQETKITRTIRKRVNIFLYTISTFFVHKFRARWMKKTFSA